LRVSVAHERREKESAMNAADLLDAELCRLKLDRRAHDRAERELERLRGILATGGPALAAEMLCQREARIADAADFGEVA